MTQAPRADSRSTELSGPWSPGAAAGPGQPPARPDGRAPPSARESAGGRSPGSGSGWPGLRVSSQAGQRRRPTAGPRRGRAAARARSLQQARTSQFKLSRVDSDARYWDSVLVLLASSNSFPD